MRTSFYQDWGRVAAPWASAPRAALWYSLSHCRGRSGMGGREAHCPVWEEQHADLPLAA